jgi:predicted secreted Zn-dependent protease
MGVARINSMKATESMRMPRIEDWRASASSTAMGKQAAKQTMAKSSVSGSPPQLLVETVGPRPQPAISVQHMGRVTNHSAASRRQFQKRGMAVTMTSATSRTAVRVGRQCSSGG